MNLDALLEQGKQKYSKEIEQERQRERIAYRRSEIKNLLNDFINQNMSKLESFRTIYPTLKVTFHQEGRLSIEKYSDKNYSGIAWLEWEFRNETFDIVFYSNIAYPKNERYSLEKYTWEKTDLETTPYQSTDEEIKQAINKSLVSMLQTYLEI